MMLYNVISTCRLFSTVAWHLEDLLSKRRQEKYMITRHISGAVARRFRDAGAPSTNVMVYLITYFTKNKNSLQLIYRVQKTMAVSVAFGSNVK